MHKGAYTVLTKIKNRKDTGGFTIIEVLIVLAIAGLIMLIVFLAVPALQRSARNTQRKNDVSDLLGAVTEYENNNNGSTPTGCTLVGTNTVEFTGPAGSAPSNAKVGYYSSGCSVTSAPAQGAIGLDLTPATTLTAPSSAADDYVVISIGQKCATSTTTEQGAARGFSAVYEIESSGGYTGQCQQS